jgi:hypothetical protein
LGYKPWKDRGIQVFVDGGYTSVRQRIFTRADTLSPLTLGAAAPESGTTDDQVTVNGPMLGVSGALRWGARIRWLVRLGSGVWLATARDVRAGRFTTSVSARPDGSIGSPATYAIGGAEQSQAARYLYVEPEVRMGAFVTKRLEISGSLQAFTAFALTQPTWQALATRVSAGTCQTPPKPGCVTDGVAVYDASSMTGRAFVFVTPGLAASYEF